ncbi:MAG: hypothetical protein C0501_19185 [Isosphaera sp.]|nr:hypothetical protein [Isosphaera sp.]
MFAPVACTACGKPFQVPRETLGRQTVCPWCRATVPALPVGLPATPPAPPGAPEPLSLDDEPAAPPPPATTRRLPRWGVAAAGLLALLLAAGATVGVLRYREGHLTGMEWRSFAAPDDSFTADLLGRAREEDAGADETRFVSAGWYSGVATWVGWRDLSDTEKGQAADKDAWQHLRKRFEVERERLKGKYGGTVVKDATTQFADPLTRELRIDYPGGRLVERMLVVRGPKARIYFVGIAGKVDPDGPEAARLFSSFRAKE